MNRRPTFGFETVGCATIIYHDDGPVLATDPWLEGTTYFGSLGLSHEIPGEVVESVEACEFLWISHALPDHFHLPSLSRLKGKTVLLPDHAGGWMKRRLEADGHVVRVMPDGEWIELSPRMRVLCASDLTQDGVLLVELGGRMLVNANDALTHGAAQMLRDTVHSYEESWLFSGTADRLGLFRYMDADGRDIAPSVLTGFEVGGYIQSIIDFLDVKFFVPIGITCRFEREESAGANAFLPATEGHYDGFSSPSCTVMPPFLRWDFDRRCVYPIDPAPRVARTTTAAEHGDDWSESLTSAESAEVAEFLRANAHIRAALERISIVVGGGTTRIDLRGSGRKLALHAPRGSLLTAVREDRLEELLCSNIVRAELEGDWGKIGPGTLFADLACFSSRIGAWGGARTEREIREYVDGYRARGTLGPIPFDPALAAALSRHA